MIAVGLDPSSTYCGLARLGDTRPRALAIRMFSGEPERSYVERLRPGLRELLDGADVLAIEQAPPTSQAQHGHQAAIGWAIGYVAGMAAAQALDMGVRVEQVPVSGWREHMLVTAARRGAMRSKPTRAARRTHANAGTHRIAEAKRASGGGFLIRWRDCAHETQVADYVALQAAGEAGCPQCSQESNRVRTDDEVRDAWKALAVELAQLAYRPLVDDLEDSARSRARHEGQPVHRLAGVADACEAIHIAEAALAARYG